MQPKGKHETAQNTNSVGNYPEFLLRYICYAARLGDLCIYSTYVVPPVVERLIYFILTLSSTIYDLLLS